MAQHKQNRSMSVLRHTATEKGTNSCIYHRKKVSKNNRKLGHIILFINVFYFFRTAISLQQPTH